MQVNAAGNFDDLWVPAGGSTPLLGIAGQLTPTSVQAALTCTNGALTSSSGNVNGAVSIAVTLR